MKSLENNQNGKWTVILAVIVTIQTMFFWLVTGSLVIILGTASIGSYIAWFFTFRKKTINPEKIVPIYCLVLASEFFHQIEEVNADFVGSINGSFHLHIAHEFMMTIFLLLAMFGFLGVIGLYKQHPLAYWYLWFVTIGPGLINSVAHVSFPLLVGQLYFPGLITVIVPTIFGILMVKTIYTELLFTNSNYTSQS